MNSNTESCSAFHSTITADELILAKHKFNLAWTIAEHFPSIWYSHYPRDGASPLYLVAANGVKLITYKLKLHSYLGFILILLPQPFLRLTRSIFHSGFSQPNLLLYFLHPPIHSNHIYLCVVSVSSTAHFLNRPTGLSKIK